VTTEDGSDSASTTAEFLPPIRTGETPEVPALTIAFHPNMGRIGHTARLTGLLLGRPVTVGRRDPLFRGGGTEGESPLSAGHISREPFALQPTRDGLLLRPGQAPLRIDGHDTSGEVRLSDERVKHGVVVTLADRVVLLLQTVGPPGPGAAAPELVGRAATMLALQDQLAKVADTDTPILIRGESGVGKELVAQAIHTLARRPGPILAVNMATIPASTAASELFGHMRGAFTGADREHKGLFERAHGGTVFLDEVGATPYDVQAMLLRVLETSQLYRLGGTRPVTVDVRVVAATDAALEAAVEAGDFRRPLLHRLARFVLTVPALRDRREDIPRLWGHFLRDELDKLGEGHRLAPAGKGEHPWHPAWLMERLLLWSWPGNVRELRNMASQLALASRGEDRAATEAIAPRLEPAEGHARSVAPVELTEDTALEALRATGFSVAAASRRLGVPNATLHDLIRRSTRIRRAGDLSREEIMAALEAADGDARHAAHSLEVSERGLRLRMKALSIPPVR